MKNTDKNNFNTANSNAMLGEVFSDREQLADFIQRNIPFCVKLTKKAKTAFVSVFTSENAMRVVIEELTDRLWEKFLFFSDGKE